MHGAAIKEMGIFVLNVNTLNVYAINLTENLIQSYKTYKPFRPSNEAVNTLYKIDPMYHKNIIPPDKKTPWP